MPSKDYAKRRNKKGTRIEEITDLSKLTPLQKKVAKDLAILGYDPDKKRNRKGITKYIQLKHGVEKHTLFIWLSYTAFRELIHAEAILIEKLAVNFMENQMAQGNWAAIQFQLEILNADRYDRKLKQLRERYRLEQELQDQKFKRLEKELDFLKSPVFLTNNPELEKELNDEKE